MFAIKSELDQILCGLSSTLGVLELFRNNPTIILQQCDLYLCAQVQSTVLILCMMHLTSTSLLMEVTRKPLKKLQLCCAWVHFLQAIERKTNIILKLSYTVTYNFTGGKGVLEIQQEKFEIIISDIMIFTTGVPSEPPLGLTTSLV